MCRSLCDTARSSQAELSWTGHWGTSCWVHMCGRRWVSNARSSSYSCLLLLRNTSYSYGGSWKNTTVNQRHSEKLSSFWCTYCLYQWNPTCNGINLYQILIYAYSRMWSFCRASLNALFASEHDREKTCKFFSQIYITQTYVEIVPTFYL